MKQKRVLKYHNGFKLHVCALLRLRETHNLQLPVCVLPLVFLSAVSGILQLAISGITGRAI